MCKYLHKNIKVYYVINETLSCVKEIGNIKHQLIKLQWKKNK